MFMCDPCHRRSQCSQIIDIGSIGIHSISQGTGLGWYTVLITLLGGGRRRSRRGREE